MGNPYWADIITNNSAQLSSNRRFWSLALSWLNDGIDLVHRTARNNSFAADSNTISWLDDELAVNVAARFVCMVKISSELLTSSSFPFKSLTTFGIGSVNSGRGFAGLESVSLFDESGEMYRLK